MLINQEILQNLLLWNEYGGGCYKMKKLLPLLLLILIGCSEPLKDGPHKEYYDNGQLWTDWTYKDGKLDGPGKIYYKNGQLQLEGTWKDGKSDGLWKGYYENGQLEVERTYKDGKENGLYKSYDENGQLLWEGTYKDGIIIDSKKY